MAKKIDSRALVLQEVKKLRDDFPEKIRENPDFEPVALPVSDNHLKKEALGTAFIRYMKRWDGFVEL